MSCLDIADDEAVKIAEPMMDDIMRGVDHRDYGLHSRHFSVDLKSQYSQEQFLSECDKREADWGRPGVRHLLTIFRKPKTFTLVWVQEFDRAEGQVMAVATVALKGGRYFVDYFLLH
ncbi:MAG: hypothetical protein KTR35_23260 [Gammaproteobacteria bacterium]|nr:hypothetical protein [Gammaproteobacteria bacterium]